ncbi:MAG TPA: DUF2267 domain-containing protein [Dissulfurispiraceae bacterium]
MEYERFIKLVQERGGLERFGEAERAASAVLEVLGEQLTPDQANSIDEQLPTHIRDAIMQNNMARPFGLHEFIRLVSDRQSVGPVEAETHIRAVFSVLSDTISLDKAKEAVDRLPVEIRELLAPVAK